MPRVIVAGSTFTTFENYLEKQGYGFVVLKDVLKLKNPHMARKNHVACDFSTEEKMLETVKKVQKDGAIGGVVTTYENYVVPASQIANFLNLPGLPLEAAQACTDKFLMRQKFATRTENISPNFQVVNGEEDLRTFAAKYGFPLILKPANLAKSLLVTKNHSLEELLKNYKIALEKIPAVYKKYAPLQTPKLLVEEFMEGSIHSVDAFVDAQGKPHVLQQVVDYQTGYDVGYDDNFHYSRLLPSKLPTDKVQAIRHVASLGCQALGIKNSPAHIEIILTKDGPKIIEIGARNGGYRERMHSIANGIDIPGNALKIAFGKTPNITARRNDPCAVLELFPKNLGVFQGISSEKELQELPSLAYYRKKVKEGDIVGKSSDGHKACAIIMLHNTDINQFQEDLKFVNQYVSVQTTL
jgi:hypothetical protein